MMGLLRPVDSKSESQNVNWDLRRPDETSDRKCCGRGERVKASSPHVRIFLKCLLRISLKCLLRIFLACWEYFSNEKIFMTFHWTTFGWRPGNRPPLDLKKGFFNIYQLWAACAAPNGRFLATVICSSGADKKPPLGKGSWSSGWTFKGLEN